MFDFRNGKPLKDLLVPEGLSHTAISFVESLKINSITGSDWSHGDASMTNVIYNEKTGRARLIDFEIRHEKSLPATARHADDLLVFLLDLVGRVSSRQWIRLAICFLRAYGDAAVMRELKKLSSFRPACP